MEARKTVVKKQTLYLGIDVHRRTWHVTGVLETGEEVFNTSMPADIDQLLRTLRRFREVRIEAVYEAGYFGYCLHDALEEAGIGCIVTPPSLIPGEYGNRVKTDRKDSRKLAMLLAKGMLKRVYVPTPAELGHRQIVRTRRTFIGDRKRKQNQIKAFLAQYGMPLPDAKRQWSHRYVNSLRSIKFANRDLQNCFDQLMGAFIEIDDRVEKQTELIRTLAEREEFRERVALLLQIHGIGLLTAMEMLVELQDIERFRTGERLAAYLGLTPSQFSSGGNVRMGHITKIGKSHLRGALIEAAWSHVRKDRIAAETFAALLPRVGKKRAIVAMARHLAMLMRSILIHRSVYHPAA